MFGLLDSGVVIAILAGSIIASPLVDALGLSGALITVGVGVSALALIGVHRTIVMDRAGAAELDAVAPIVELLASLPILELAPRASIEQLAQAATIEEVDAGRVVVAQGDPADDLYAVFSGELEVEITHPDGQREVVGTVGPGGFFGEIGLIQGVPRTATVAALTPTRLAACPAPPSWTRSPRRPPRGPARSKARRPAWAAASPWAD